MTDLFMFTAEIKGGDTNLETLNKDNRKQVLRLPRPVCRSPSMMCPGTSLCISQIRLCDGNMDCPDGFDEVSCVDACSKPGNFHLIFNLKKNPQRKGQALKSVMLCQVTSCVRTEGSVLMGIWCVTAALTALTALMRWLVTWRLEIQNRHH